MTKAVLIYGGSRNPSRLQGIYEKALEYLKGRGIDVQSINVPHIPAEDLIHTKFNSPAIQEANRLLNEAEAVVVLTPVYKASFSGILKTYLDLVPQKGLQNKTVLPIAIGGSLGHLLSIEYSLKPVLSILGANRILDSIFIHDEQVKRLESNEYFIEEGAAFRLHNGLEKLGDGLKDAHTAISS
ncbi:NADPH-dependent FMN reductase [Aciduricibacillus chroicocephali]|uniref:NADPH-dependent FMN reductase n=1 Tax=Aciduricibacillus chroicocephali TaxID=3054939 RepID=A0ABY9KT23_9BACI|nr:NADPH-dependent FMN reductase [Bacillaceae bacterium 44XB]